MLETAIYKESEAAKNHVLVKHPDLKGALEKAHGYIVFPKVGRASAAIGGARGYGHVYERGQSIGFATLTQLTLGVQVGGQTFTEIVIFNKEKPFEEFKHRGTVGFSANASATIVKAAATGTTDVAGVQAMAFGRGGMLLELSLGGASFQFIPPMQKPEPGQAFVPSEAPRSQEGEQAQGKETVESKPPRNETEQREPKEATSKPGSHNGHDGGGLKSRVREGLGKVPLVGRIVPPRAGEAVEHAVDAAGKQPVIGKAVSKIEEVTERARDDDGEDGHDVHGLKARVLDRLGSVPHLPRPVVSAARKVAAKSEKVTHKVADATGHQTVVGKAVNKAGQQLAGLRKEEKLSATLHKDVEAALKAAMEANPQFAKVIDEAYGYAVFPAVGRASLLLGSSFGKGEVFERGKLVGYAGVFQLTLGVQLGGDTLTEVVVFSDKASMDRFKQAKMSFAANASAVLVNAGAGASNKYKGARVFVFAQGGLLIEAAIGVQKFAYRKAGLTRGESLETEPKPGVSAN